MSQEDCSHWIFLEKYVFFLVVKKIVPHCTLQLIFNIGLLCPKQYYNLTKLILHRPKYAFMM